MSSAWTNYSANSRDDEAASGPSTISEDVPACMSCKKRKLRCSRETPTCSHCVRLAVECVYTPKQKPGLKPGALEALTRRVGFLEQILLDGAGRIRPQFGLDGVENDDTASGHSEPTRDEHIQPREQRTDAIPLASSRLSDRDFSNHDQNGSAPLVNEANPRKRKLDQPSLASTLLTIRDIDIAEHLPPQPLLLKLVDFFCTSFHHWIPYVHKQRLRDSVSNASGRSDLVLHALVSVTLHRVDPEAIFLEQDEVLQQRSISHFIVDMFAMRTVSLESLRALIMIAFAHLNEGDATKAWPLIGSLTRTVDYLQLTVEPSASQSGALMNPLQLVPTTDDWTELEERRRLFWVIFLLDRFCSVSTGWNTSLTSEDVHRRLPADGGYFTREEPVTTPFFGIWNKAAARIGRSLAHVPAQYEDETTPDATQGTSPSSTNGLIDSSKLGAFAYCVEATESLSQVTTFFLQQRINWQDKEHAISWLTRFKELDLRLVQWKMFLPPRWKDSNISQNAAVIDMDPNLTLAHITHNTSMILLHHSIAYPPKEWSDYVALPKECSALTCQHAAVETSNIVSKFLTHTPIPFVNVQFAFCAFIAAKALLFEHQTTRKAIRPEFHRLVQDLWEMSSRWALKHVDRSSLSDVLNQAGRYAHHLDSLYNDSQRDAHFLFDFYDHSCRAQTSSSYSASSTPQRSREPPFTPRVATNHRNGPAPRNAMISPTGATAHKLPENSDPSVAYPSPTAHAVALRNPNSPAPASHIHLPSGFTPLNMPPHLQSGLPGHHEDFQAPIQEINAPPIGHYTLQDQSLVNLSDTLMGSQFLDMDRVITFEEANFYLPGDAFRW